MDSRLLRQEIGDLQYLRLNSDDDQVAKNINDAINSLGIALRLQERKEREDRKKAQEDKNWQSYIQEQF